MSRTVASFQGKPSPSWAVALVRQTGRARRWPAETTEAAAGAVEAVAGEFDPVSAEEWWPVAVLQLEQVLPDDLEGRGGLINAFRSAGGQAQGEQDRGDNRVLWNTVVASSEDARQVGKTGGAVVQAASRPGNFKLLGLGLFAFGAAAFARAIT